MNGIIGKLDAAWFDVSLLDVNLMFGSDADTACIDSEYVWYLSLDGTGSLFILVLILFTQIVFSRVDGMSAVTKQPKCKDDQLSAIRVSFALSS